MPARKIGAGDVADFAADYELIESAQYFFDRSERVEAVEVIDIDVVGAEALQAGFTSPNQMVARRSNFVGAAIAHRKVALVEIKTSARRPAIALPSTVSERPSE